MFLLFGRAPLIPQTTSLLLSSPRIITSTPQLPKIKSHSPQIPKTPGGSMYAFELTENTTCIYLHQHRLFECTSSKGSDTSVCVCCLVSTFAASSQPLLLVCAISTDMPRAGSYLLYNKGFYLDLAL